MLATNSSVIRKNAGLFVNAITQVMNLHLVASVAFKEMPDRNGCVMFECL